MLRQPLNTELTAATVIAAEAGLGMVSAEVLHLGNHTAARLHPWPIVARIASGTSFDFFNDSIGRELRIAAHLSCRKAPCVRPTPIVAPGPYVENDCAITFWEFVDGRDVATQADERAAATSLQRFHTSLAHVHADLPSFITKVESCETILMNPDQAPKLAASDRLFLEKLYDAFRRDLDGIGGTWQPLHGDTHLGNVRITGAGAIWMDLEAVCLGPLEWDIATLPVRTWRQFPEVDRTLMRLIADVRSLCVAVWCWAEFERSAATEEAAIYHLGELKRRFS